MKKHLILFSILLAAANVFSQPYYIKFVATGAATTLDSVEVKNLKKGTFLTLKGTDDLRLVKYVGIQNLSSGQENVSVYPSPMQEQAELSFYAKEAGTARITIYDISGKEVAGMSTLLSSGQQKFEVKGLHEGSYVVKVCGDNYLYNLKLTSINNLQNHPVISYTGNANPQFNPIQKTTMATIDMPYSTGDTMRYTGYSGTYKAVVKNVPTSSLTVTFNFIPNVPILTTKAVSGITDNSAISGGNITSDQGYPVTARGVCWGTSPNPVDTNSHTSDGTGKGVFTSNITGLSDGTLYYVRAYATNIIGTSYGNQLSFTTMGRPTVTTTAISSKTDSSAKSGGNVISDGGYPVTARGVCWDTSANPEITDNHTVDGIGTGSFVSYITGLDSNKTYYIRSYATNSFGTGYGNQLSFSTKKTNVKDGLVAYYPFNGNANDESGNGNDGTVYGATLSVDRKGDSISAYYFDGVDDYINISRVIQDSFTISFWFISTQGISTSKNWYNGAGMIDAEVSGIVNDFSTSLNSDGYVLAGTGNPDVFLYSNSPNKNDNTWHHVVFTRDKSDGSVKLYVDNVFEMGKTGNTKTLDVPQKINFGRLQTAIHYFKGSLDDIRIYNRVLNDNEIQQLYNE